MWSFITETAHAQFKLGLPFNGTVEYGSFNEYFTDLINFAVVIAVLVSVLVVVYAGIMYAQSQGEASKVAHAKELIAGALTGLILLFLVRLIVPTLNIGGQSFFGIDSAFAQVTNQLDLGKTKLPGLTLDDFFGKVINLLEGIVAFAAFSGIVYSGYMIITAGGDTGKAAKGRSNLLWSVLGLIVALLAYTITSFAFRLGEAIR
jgi:hypothetical protein